MSDDLGTFVIHLIIVVLSLAVIGTAFYGAVLSHRAHASQLCSERQAHRGTIALVPCRP